MSDSGQPAKKKKGKGKTLILGLGLVVGIGGAGAAGGLYAAGAFKAPEGPHVDPNKPVLVLKGENPDDVAAAHGGGGQGEGAAAAEPGKGHGGAGGHGAQAAGIDLPAPTNPSAYQATYFQVQAPFTSNMADTDSFAQISIAVSTYYDSRVIQAMQTHEMAIRSAILMMLAEQEEFTLSTPQGKEALQKKLKAIINQVLKQKTGYGGVDNVYFTNFVIQ